MNYGFGKPLQDKWFSKKFQNFGTREFFEIEQLGTLLVIKTNLTFDLQVDGKLILYFLFILNSAGFLSSYRKTVTVDDFGEKDYQGFEKICEKFITERLINSNSLSTLYEAILNPCFEFKQEISKMTYSDDIEKIETKEYKWFLCSRDQMKRSPDMWRSRAARGTKAALRGDSRGRTTTLSFQKLVRRN